MYTRLICTYDFFLNILKETYLWTLQLFKLQAIQSKRSFKDLLHQAHDKHKKIQGTPINITSQNAINKWDKWKKGDEVHMLSISF